MREAPDTVFVGGHTLLPAAPLPVPVGVAVRGGRILAVAPDDELRDLVGTAHRGRRPGRWAAAPRLPGRPRPPGDGRRRPAALRPPRRDVGGARRSRRSRPTRRPTPTLEWIVGGGWWMEHYAGGTPTREALDAVVPDRPVFLTNKDGHGAWVNSRALELAGIDASTPDPADGRIERRPGRLARAGPCTREPAPARGAAAPGRHRDEQQLAGLLSWPRSCCSPWASRPGRTRQSASSSASRTCSRPTSRRPRTGSCGPASSAHCGGTASAAPSRSPTSRSVAPRPGRPVPGHQRQDHAGRCRRELHRRHARAVPRRLRLLDGQLRSQLRRPRRAAASHVTELDARGFQVHFHALGDRAVREALDALEAARAANGPSDGRHHLAHLQVVHPDDIPRFARLGAVANIQPLWASPRAADGRAHHPVPRGASASSWQYPFADLAAGRRPAGRGQRLVGVQPGPAGRASTSPSTGSRLGPRVPRRSRSTPEQPAHPRRRPSTAYTAGSAYVNHHEDVDRADRGRARWPTSPSSTATPSPARPSRSPTPASSSTYVDGELVYSPQLTPEPRPGGTAP